MNLHGKDDIKFGDLANRSIPACGAILATGEVQFI
jgi:hypothetical protein